MRGGRVYERDPRVSRNVGAGGDLLVAGEGDRATGASFVCAPLRQRRASRISAQTLPRAPIIASAAREPHEPDARSARQPLAYRLSDFDYELPPELIAQHPARERSASRLLHVDGEKLADLRFPDLVGLLGRDDVVVLNDTRVINARLRARKRTGGQVELLVERVLGDDEALVQLRASHPPGVDAVLQLDGNATATVVSRDERWYRLRFAGTGALDDWIARNGRLPLPPYITHPADATDAERYQTVYARIAGAVAAPTAGLHFDRTILDTLAARGVATAFLTLHVGAGTFQPVQHDDLSRHRMHAERYTIPATVVDAIRTARSRGGRVLAVGTTTLRALEAAADPAGLPRVGIGETALFVTPGYRFRVVDRLLTNFHLPRSTLLMLVGAFAGMGIVRRAYSHAIARRYRFFSYGDAMLLERAAVAA